jgi:hypothetical protein
MIALKKTNFVIPSKANYLQDNLETIRFAHGTPFCSRFPYKLNC